MKRALNTDMADAQEAGIEPLAADLTSWPNQGQGEQMCLGGVPISSAGGQEGFLPTAAGMECQIADQGFPDASMDPSGTPWRKLPTCHGAMLLGGTPHMVEAQGQRVCPSCNTACRKSPFVVPADRVRMLSELIGVWSKAREFYTRWEVATGLTVYVRRYPVAADSEGNLSLVLFRSAQDALLVDSWLGATGRVRHIAENVSFTMCSRVKTFCPCCNFASSMDRGCVLHYGARCTAKGGGSSAAPVAPASAPETLVPPLPSPAGSLGPADFPSMNMGGADGGGGALGGGTAGAAATHDPLLGPPSSASSDGRGGGGGGAAASRGLGPGELPRGGDYGNSRGSSTSPETEISELSEGSVMASDVVPSAGELVVDGLRVMHDLCVHGEAWKLGGSSQWRVLSDARVKDVLSDFTLGGETLLKIVPRVFRYKGQPAHERSYVGIIAQELPEELVPFCRFRTNMTPAALQARMQAGGGAGGGGGLKLRDPEAGECVECDEEATGGAAVLQGEVVVDLNAPEAAGGKGRGGKTGEEEATNSGESEDEDEGLYLVDLSALQFVMVNAYKELEGRVRAQQREVSELRRRADKRQAEQEARGAAAPRQWDASSAAFHPLLLRFRRAEVQREYRQAWGEQHHHGLKTVLRVAAFAGLLFFVLGMQTRHGWGFLGQASYWQDSTGVAHLANVLVMLAASAATYAPAFFARWRGALLLLLLACADATVLLQLGEALLSTNGGADFADGGSTLDARTQDTLRFWYGIGLAIAPLAAHAEPHWPTFCAMQLGLSAAFMGALAWARSEAEHAEAHAGAELEEGEAAGRPFAGALRLCFMLLVPHLLALVGVYLLLRAKLAAFAAAHTKPALAPALAAPPPTIATLGGDGGDGGAAAAPPRAGPLALAATQSARRLGAVMLPRVSSKKVEAVPAHLPHVADAV